MKCLQVRGIALCHGTLAGRQQRKRVPAPGLRSRASRPASPWASTRLPSRLGIGCASGAGIRPFRAVIIHARELTARGFTLEMEERANRNSGAIQPAGDAALGRRMRGVPQLPAIPVFGKLAAWLGASPAPRLAGCCGAGARRLCSVAVEAEAVSRLSLRRGFVLEYVTLSWNVAGMVVLAVAAQCVGVQRPPVLPGQHPVAAATSLTFENSRPGHPTAPYAAGNRSTATDQLRIQQARPQAAFHRRSHRAACAASVWAGRGGRSGAEHPRAEGTGPRRRERLRHRRRRPRRGGRPLTVRGRRARRSARRRGSLRRRRSRRRRGTPGQSAWSARQPSCGRRRGTGFGCGCWRRSRGSRARARRRPAGRCRQTGGQARLVWLGSGHGGDRHGHERRSEPGAASSDGPRTSAANEPPVVGTCENHSRPPATSSMPAIRGGLKPTRVTSGRRRRRKGRSRPRAAGSRSRS